MDNNDNEEDEELFLLKVLAARLAQHELTDAAAAVPPLTGSSTPATAAGRSVRAGRTSRPTVLADNKSENQSGLTLDTEENSFVEDSAGEGSTSTTESAQYASRRHRKTSLVSTCGATGTAAATTTVPGAYDVAGPDSTMPGVQPGEQTLRRPSFLTANPPVASSDSMSSFSGSDSDHSRENGEMPPIVTETAAEEAAPEDNTQREKKIFLGSSKRQRILIACAVCAILAIATGLLVSFLPRDKGSNTPLRNSYELDQPSRPSQVSEDYSQPGGPPVHDWKPTLRPSATSKTTMAPSTTPTATPLPECALNLDQNETGYVELRLQGMPTEEDGTLPDNVKEELEELFREVYTNVSGLCLDPYNRVLEQATLTESTTAAQENDDQVASIVTTYWDARVTCNGCPSEEPLFSTGSSETIRRRLQEDLRLFDQSTDFLPLFASTLGYHLNELLINQQPQQTVAGVNVILATTKRPANSGSSTVSSENDFISVMSIDKDAIESFDEYVTSINGQVLAPFATDELRVLEACYAVGKNREDATQVTGVCRYLLQDESLGLEVAGANNCFQSVLTMEHYCQDALDPLFDALVSGTKEGLDFNAIPTGGSSSLNAIWELSSDRTIAPTKTLFSYQGVPTAITGTGSSSPTTKAGAATFNPSPSPSQSEALDTKGEERDRPENAPSGIAAPTVPTSSPTVSKATILPGPTLKPTVEPAPSSAPFLTPLPTLDPTIFPTAMSVSAISVDLPTIRPTREPTPQPTRLPSTPLPTRCPTPNPTVPSTRSTPEPTPAPTPDPTLQPAPLPTRLPSIAPATLSLHPSLHPSPAPSYNPSTSNLPSAMPSSSPSLRPSGKPSIQPSSTPSGSPSLSILPTAKPSLLPSWAPSLQPSLMTGGSPSSPVPSTMPSAQPSLQTSDTPSSKPTEGLSSTPSKSIAPSGGPSSLPSVQPSRSPSLMPSRTPSNNPSVEPSGEPSQAPSLTPSQAPTAQTCFTNNGDLRNAVRDDYTDPNGSIYLTYGPVEYWCFEPSVDNFGGLFGSITFNEDISGWDVAGVTNFGSAFEWNSDFNQDISGWDVSTSDEFSYMFDHATSFNQPIGSWDVGNQAYFQLMFDATDAFNQPLDSWDMSNAWNMHKMFGSGAFNSPLDSWDVSGGKFFSSMFDGSSSFNQPLNFWDVSSGEDFSEMFAGSSFNQAIFSLPTSLPLDLEGMFRGTSRFSDGTSAFNQPLDLWDVSSVRNMRQMFLGTTTFNQPLDSWDTSGTGNMIEMFSASIFNQPLASWDVGQTVDFTRMFQNSMFNQDLCSWAVTIDNAGVNRRFFYDMFSGTSCPSVSAPRMPVFDAGMYDDFCYTCNPSLTPSQAPSRTPSNKPSVEPSGEPSQAPSLTPSQAPTAQPCFANNGDLWNAVRDDYTDPNGSIYLTYGPVEYWCFEPSVDNFARLFDSITFNEDISGWDVAGVTSFSGAFARNPNFNQDISGWDISNVSRNIGFWFMFADATSFNQPIGSWDVGNQAYFQGMFEGADAFNQPLDSWDMSNAEDMQQMFWGNTAFNQPLASWDTSGTWNMIEMFAERSIFNQPLASWDVGQTEVFTRMFQNSMFNQDLCSWAVTIDSAGSTPVFTQMFRQTSCPSVSDPANPVFDAGIYDDFCYTC